MDIKEHDNRIWQRFTVGTTIADVARLGTDQGMEQVVVIVRPTRMNSFFFLALTDNREHDIPATVSRLIGAKT